MPAPIFSLSTSGTDPKATSKGILEDEVNRVVGIVYDQANPEDRDAAAASATAAAASADAAAASETQAGTDAQAAQAAAEASGDVLFYDTKADATAALGGLTENQVVRVFSDESRDGRSYFYRVESAALVYKAVPEGPNDLVGREMLSQRLTERRVNLMPLKQSLEDVRNGLRDSLRVMSIGDSLATVTQQAFIRELIEVLKPNFNDALVRNVNRGAECQIGEIRSGSSTATRGEKIDYAVSFVGTKTTHTAGQVSYWSVGGLSIYCDRISVPLVTASGAGSLKIEIAEADNALDVTGAAWRAPTAGEVSSGHTLTGSDLIVSTDGATGCDTVVLDFDVSERRILRVTSTSGTGVMLDPMFSVVSEAAVNFYSLAASSNSFGAAQSASIPVMIDLIGDYAPDIIVITSDDTTAAYQNFLPMLSQAIDGSGLTPSPYIVLVGNPGIAAGGVTESDLKNRIDYCAAYAAPRGWDNLDGMALGLGHTNLQTFQRGGDTVHLTAFIWRQMTRYWAKTRDVEYVREHIPGGEEASRADIAAATGDRFILAKDIAHALTAQAVFDQGWMEWSFTVTGTASGTKGAAALQLGTGATADSKLKAYVNDGHPPFGGGSTNQVDTARDGSWLTMLRLVNMSANAKAWVLTSQENLSAGYTALAGNGFGFRVTDTTIEGVSWYNGSLQVASGSVSATDGASSPFYRLQCVWTGGVINAGAGQVEFFVDGVSLGIVNYSHSNNTRSPCNFHLTNGADATDCTIAALPPRLVFT